MGVLNLNNEREQLICDLRGIKEDEYNLPKNKGVNDYVPLMLKYIGDSDPELRDGLIYEVFTTWIEDKFYFTDEELIELFNTLLSDNFAFYKIGCKDDDSVLRRSFSILLISPILFLHLDRNFLDNSMIMKAKDAFLRFVSEEKDLRSIDNGKGWIHAMAHVSDGIHALLNCKGITEDTCMAFLKVIENKLCEGSVLFGGEEDERMINFIYYDIILDKLLSEDCICNWILGFKKVLDIKEPYLRFRARVNAKNFMRSLYFRILNKENNEQIVKVIIDMEQKLNPYSH